VLSTDEDGLDLLHVTKGWVSFEWKGLESLVPAGASCRTRPQAGPGIPYFDDAPDNVKQALEILGVELKAAAFVFRTEGCVDPAKPQIAATSEGLVKGARRSVVLKVVTGCKPNIYAVFQNWPEMRLGSQSERYLRERDCGRDCPHRSQRLCQRIRKILSASGHRHGNPRLLKSAFPRRK
jgi:hypothetical protein